MSKFCCFNWRPWPCGHSDSVATAARNRSGGEAANAHDGLKLRTSHPDIAIVDIGLPDKDIELTRQIKPARGWGLGSIPVLILTLRDNKEAVLGFVQGADLLHERLVSIICWKRCVTMGQCLIDPAIARIVLQQAQQSSETTQAAALIPKPLLSMQLM